ncbi:putative nuclease HARBI1 [Mercenaria mercenaria]|uniref:putative nuclease HARBI1 n=1 Tax=Mercenaria mercenaria TaxID=6596 RepID=UPI00234ED49F|nr:putative nuclease HARBI1 [Mercenaria mercenaria]
MSVFDYLDMFEELDRNLRRERIVRDRTNPLTYFDDDEFLQRYHLSKETVLELTNMIGGDIHGWNGQYYIPPLLQILITLRFFGTGSFLNVIGDLVGVHKSSVSRIVKSVSGAIAALRRRFIVFPTDNAATRIQRDFMNVGRIPGVIGAIDCTHIPILCPGGDKAELFRNRKGYFSINVQAVCDSDFKFTNIVARWPGSTHDSRIFDNSTLCAKFENGDIRGTLVGDNGYPLRQYLLTPVLQPQTRGEQRFNRHLSSIRVRIENLFGIWKRRFPCTRYQLRVKLSTALVVIVACAVLHNLARMMMEPIPDDNDQRPFPEEVDGEHVRREEGGRAIRNMLIRHFE